MLCATWSMATEMPDWLRASAAASRQSCILTTGGSPCRTCGDGCLRDVPWLLLEGKRGPAKQLEGRDRRCRSKSSSWLICIRPVAGLIVYHLDKQKMGFLGTVARTAWLWQPHLLEGATLCRTCLARVVSQRLGEFAVVKWLQTKMALRQSDYCLCPYLHDFPYNM